MIYLFGSILFACIWAVIIPAMMHAPIEEEQEIVETDFYKF
jgi:hypothetical protein